MESLHLKFQGRHCDNDCDFNWYLVMKEQTFYGFDERANILWI